MSKLFIVLKEWFPAPDGNFYKVVFGTFQGNNGAATFIGGVEIPHGNILVAFPAADYERGEYNNWSHNVSHPEGRSVFYRYKSPCPVFNADEPITLTRPANVITGPFGEKK